MNRRRSAPAPSAAPPGMKHPRPCGQPASGSTLCNLVSRKGQEVNRICLFAVEPANSALDNVIGRFVVIR